MKENEILQTAIQHLGLQSGLTVRALRPSRSKNNKGNEDPEIGIKVGGAEHRLLVETKNELRSPHLGSLLNADAFKSSKRLLVSQYISKPNRTLLKQQGINYLDASGNCFIRYRSLLLYINDNPVTAQRMPERGKLWKTAGLKMLFALLVKPALLKQSYRTIGLESNIALGMVGPLLKEMESEGFLQRTESLTNLENREILLNRWVENFQSYFRPKISKGRFRFVNTQTQSTWSLTDMKQAKWSGEPAAFLLTNYLHPQKFTIYSDLTKQELIKQFKVMPDPHGELEILTPFWNASIGSSHQHCVPELLVFAELASSLDSRSRDTAHRLKKMFHV